MLKLENRVKVTLNLNINHKTILTLRINILINSGSRIEIPKSGLKINHFERDYPIKTSRTVQVLKKLQSEAVTHNFNIKTILQVGKIIKLRSEPQ